MGNGFYTILLVVHVLIAFGLIGMILFQRSSEGGLGSLSGGGSNIMSGRAQANLLTRATAILATLFILTSLALGVMLKHDRTSVFDRAIDPTGTQPAPGIGADIKNRADQAQEKKAVKDAGGKPAPVVQPGTTEKTIKDGEVTAEKPANPPAVDEKAPQTETPSVPKGE